MMRKQLVITFVATAACALAVTARATVLVNDTWRDGTRTDPAPATYAENNGVTATDADADGDLESAWFRAGSGTFGIVTNNPPITGPNILEGNLVGSSASWFTYFTQPTTPVTLSAPGQEMKVTWVFKPTGVNAGNSSKGFNVAVALTPDANRDTTDTGVQSANYTNGFAAFMNMGTAFGASGISLCKWQLAGSGSLLGTAANYTSFATAGALAATGYLDGNLYTFVMDLNMTAGGLQVTETMTGDNINNSGVLSATYLDASLAGQSVSYNTFDIRPGNAASTANTFDTSLFKVEVIPEPSTVALLLCGLGLTVGLIRRRRS